MFLRQLVEDYEFDDIKFVFENDKYFLYCSEKYKLTEEDEINFEDLKNSDEEFKKYSLEVVTLKKIGLLSRAEIMDQEDETRSIRDIDFKELSSYPVDMVYSSTNRRALQLIVSILLEKTFYKILENNNVKNDLNSLGSLELEKAVHED